MSKQHLLILDFHQVDKVADNASEQPSSEMQDAADAIQSDEEEEEEVDEMVFGQDSDSSQNSDEDVE
jgi:U3 small nucleolar RNA-associated protein 5